MYINKNKYLKFLLVNAIRIKTIASNINIPIADDKICKQGLLKNVFIILTNILLQAWKFVITLELTS